ncbi:up-regulator of cell proliferation-like [Seriola lalandi dorsalis]|uniref:up-regulator of cell proliferation-like n=1 Tax=Seriola lalandi dorsalis TaxID=1841481 RepID=UPI000C6F4CDB|nr:up-regulator of cell proliferation-like [Seriola lalandi dorsalis]
MATEGTSGLLNFLSKLGLEKFYPNKLTLRSLLEINKKSISDETVKSVDEIPWCFLRKLLKINAECRNCAQLPKKDDDDDDDGEEEEEKNDLLDFDKSTGDEENKVNPLDLIVALFLCADSFLQQEMALKMSMCQFPVPLLMPHGNKNQCTLMLWALREIVKEWRPHDLSESKGFVEENIVQADIPFFSFVRLKNCSLSKSQVLNHVLSLGQYNNNIFIHKDMKGGAPERKIANGLVEVCWYLPGGTENMDIFPKPIAFANLRGDIGQSLSQFSFLFQVSTATFVFLDRVVEDEHRILTSLQDVRSKLFLVVNRKAENGREDMMSVKTTLGELDLPKASVKIKDSRVNVARFSEKLCTAIKKSTTCLTNTKTIENMVEKVVDLGLSVDECKSDDQKKAAMEIRKGIGVRSISDYKSKQLPLQGIDWKRLSQLEMEERRLKRAGDQELEEYKSHLQEEKQQIKEKLGKHKLSRDMKTFIKHLSKSDKEKRDFFLKWMNYKLNEHLRSVINLPLLRNKLTEHCNKKDKDVQISSELDQALLDSSLGIEHYMREMGLIYEVSLQDIANEMSRLPGVAAEMLLDGYPLELLDGDASNIPERWVTDVLMELHKKVGEKSRLLVLTVLGVQSSGKSTLLNTMFGVQFPVSSGRCTRGAFMLFLRVGEDMQSDMNCDFIVLIDTEGLKSPHLAHLEDSYEHDNQLATFVIGLSDVTIINIAMENSTEMKDVLQIATHAFLRMKQIGRKPVCHFVHQNVGAVSAHAKTMTERKHLLDQLNEMTQLAAKMEKQPDIKAFTDVLEYDVEKNNWNIPGLWHGTPPMAPVNTGYSVAVADFKKNLLETVKRDTRDEVSQIPEFLEWMRSLWKAVKYENFIFSFRNTLMAHAYDNLCKEFNQWDWDFRKEILSWQSGAELEILNADNEAELETWNRLVETKKSEVSEKITDQQTIMKRKLQEYYKRKDGHVTQIEKYKADFTNSIRSLANEIQHSVNNKLDCALELRKSSKEAQDIQRRYRGVIEERVMKLLVDCKESTLSDEELTHEKEKERELQRIADEVIESCTRIVLDTAKTDRDYNDCFIKDLLEKIDDSLKQYHNHYNPKFVIDLKLHICGIASREFLYMHRKFLLQRDPKIQLEKHKTQYLSDFKDLYKQQDHCQRKASDFVQLCIKPAVEEYISRCLGINIVDEILTSSHSAEYSSRSFFQYSILKELLQKEDFESFVKCICNYEIYAKDWIFQHILQKVSEDDTLCKLKNNNLQVIVDKMKQAIQQASKGEGGVLLPDNTESITELINNMRKYLIKDISISVEAEKTTLFQIQSTCDPFINSLKISIDDLKDQLHEEFSNSGNITETLNKLPVKPQDELFKRVFGCRRQCPFCKVPCEAGGKEHKKHHAAVHRPQGLGRYRNIDTQKLVATLCTTDVHSEGKFRNADTNWEPHPYKDYTTYYPDWHIPPDNTIEASDYWKYVLVQYNDRFAQRYQANPLLYTPFTHHCTSTHGSKAKIKLADDTTIVDLISDNNETT